MDALLVSLSHWLMDRVEKVINSSILQDMLSAVSKRLLCNGKKMRFEMRLYKKEWVAGIALTTSIC